MNLKLEDLVTAEAPLQRLVEREVSAKVAFHLARIVRRVNPELRDYGTARIALLKRVGTLSEDETGYDIEPQHQAEFAGEMRALLDTEIELDIVPVAEDDLPDLTAAAAMALWWLVEEPGDPTNGREG